MRTSILTAILAVAVAGLGCTKNDSPSATADPDATGAAKSAEGETCPHHKDKAAGEMPGKMHGGDKHDCAMHEGKECDRMASGDQHDCAMHEGKPCDMMHEGKPCDMMHDGKPCDMMGGGKMDGAGPMDPAEHAAKLAERVGLDADQTAKVQALFVDFAPRQQALRDRMLAVHQGMDKSKDGAGLDEQAITAKKAEFAAVRADRAKLHQELFAAIEPILTPDQRVGLQEMKAQHHGMGDKKAEGDGSCGCGGHGDPK